MHPIDISWLAPEKMLALVNEENSRRKKLHSLLKGEGKTSLVYKKGHPFNDLLKKARYKIFFGGRGASKSWAVAEYLIRHAVVNDTRILCTREYQNSIADSVHRLLTDTIDKFGFNQFFKVTNNYISSINSKAEFLFKGLHNNVQEIKSTEGIGICWVEEAQSVSESSWELLIPTIRGDLCGGDSEIIITLNPREESDATFKRFIDRTPPKSIKHHINFDQNPYFPEVLEVERQYYLQLIREAANDDERESAQSDYDHVWLGEVRRINNQVVFSGKYLVESFSDDLWKKAPRLLFGADFGFSQDPSTLIRAFVLDNILYIEHEAWGVGVEFSGNMSDGRGELEQFYNSVPESTKWPIKADCSRPETISFIRSLGFRISAAEKWSGSVEDGIAYMRGFKKIIVHPRCKKTAEEFRSYKYKIDRISGDVLPILIDKNNHCIAEGCLVTTLRGDVPIEQVVVGDKVLTRNGYKKVLFSGLTDVDREIVEVHTKSNSVYCTPDHEIWTENRAFVRADALRYNDILLTVNPEICTSRKSYIGTENNIDDIQHQIIPRIGTILGALKTFLLHLCTEMSGNFIAALSKKGMKSTTSIKIQETILYRILRYVRLVLSTCSITRGATNIAKKCYRILLEYDLLRKLGTAAKRVWHTIAKPRCWRMRRTNPLKKYAINAKSPSGQKNQDIPIDFAEIIVNQPAEEPAESTILNASAQSAKLYSERTNMIKPYFVAEPVLCVTGIGFAKRVYDLTVEEDHEFFANGVLVSNCIDAIRYGLDGYIKKSGNMATWERFGK